MDSRERLIFIDNVRILLIFLVIAHHAGQAYGPTGGWWAYSEASRLPELSLLFSVNRSFFMSLFFMVSGYFMPASFDAKGAGPFLRGRLRRFGIPMLFFLFAVIPLQHYAYFLHFRPYGDIPFLRYYTDYYWGMGAKPADWSGPGWPEANLGHLWFVEHLLVFALCYAILRLVWKKPVRIPSGTPGHRRILFVTLVVAVLTFAVRLWYPIDRWIAFLGFIQVAFADVPRDLTWFIVGVTAYRGNWFQTVERKTGLTWLAVGLAMVAILVVAYLCGPEWPRLLRSKGGTAWPQSFIYPIWESLLCSGMCVGLPVLFREYLNFRNDLGRIMADNAYGAYLFHVPAIVALQYAVGGLSTGPGVKFVLVTLLTVLIAFGLTALLRRSRAFSSVL